MPSFMGAFLLSRQNYIGYTLRGAVAVAFIGVAFIVGRASGVRRVFIGCASGVHRVYVGCASGVRRAGIGVFTFVILA